MIARASLGDPPPKNPSMAAAYWCEMDYFLVHTATGDHPPCRCPEGQGHNDASIFPSIEATV